MQIKLNENDSKVVTHKTADDELLAFLRSLAELVIGGFDFSARRV
jgi:hypothetical protein